MTTPGAPRPQLRPLSLGEILDVAIKIFFAHWATLLKAVLVVVVPVQIIITVLTADYTVDSLDFGNESQTPSERLEELNQYLGGIAISALLQVCAVLLASAACFRAIAQVYLGEQADWRSSLRFALNLMPSLVLLTLLYVLGWGMGALLFIAPGVWLYVAWAFAMPVLLVEGLRGPRALGRSYALVKGRWWRTFLVLLIGFLLALVVSTIVQGVFFIGMFAGADNTVLVLVLSAIAGIVGLAISTPFQAALLAVVYFDLRVRKEGFDLELLAQGIGGEVPADGAGPLPAVVAQPLADAPAGTQHWPSPSPSPQPAAPADSRPAPAPPPPGWAAPSNNGTADDAGRAEDEPPDDPPRLPGVPDG